MSTGVLIEPYFFDVQFHCLRFVHFYHINIRTGERVPDVPALIQRITKREGACGIVSRSYRSASRVYKNPPLNHENTIRIMSFLRLNCRALRKRYAERYISVTSPSTLGVLQKKVLLKAFKIRKSPQVSRNVNTPKSLPVIVFYTKKSGRPGRPVAEKPVKITKNTNRIRHFLTNF